MYRYGLPCLGGKNKLITKLLPIIGHIGRMEKVDTFLDICGGGGKLACSVAAGYLYKTVLYNDIDYGMASVIACLRNKAQANWVVKQIEKMLSDSDGLGVYREALQHRKDAALTVEQRGVNTLYCLLTSYANSFHGYCEKRKAAVAQNKGYYKYARYWYHLQRLQVTCGDCKEVLDRYASANGVVVFIDPPYYESTFGYDCGLWKRTDYEELVNKIRDCPHFVILCGREEDRKVYDCLLESARWNRTCIGQVEKSAAYPNIQVDEYIWTNFEVPQCLQ